MTKLGLASAFACWLVDEGSRAMAQLPHAWNSPHAGRETESRRAHAADFGWKARHLRRLERTGRGKL